MGLKWNFKKKGLLFISIIGIVAWIFTYYAVQKNSEINQYINQAEELGSTADILQKAQISAYNAVSELLVLFQAKSRDEAVNLTHSKFLYLLANYERITELYPEKRAGFKAFMRSLADSVTAPTRPKLQSLATELSNFQSELDEILQQVVKQREELVEQYTLKLRELLMEIVLTVSAIVLLLSIIVTLFLKRLTGDIKILNFSLGRVLHSSSQPLVIELDRNDELQQLSERIAELSERLQKREQALSIEQRQSAHLEQNKALEYLTRGLVHAIGNPVTGLIGLIQHLQNHEVTKEELEQNLAAMFDSAQKIQSINEDLKMFSVRTGKERELLDLNYVLSEQLRLMAYDDHWFGINTKFNPAQNLPVFHCSKDDIGIIIENLLENALEALRKSSKSEQQLSIDTLMVDSTYIGFVVTDNANGMTPEVKQHAMDAFYSTKRISTPGGGMGLLSCLNIVEKYGGKISIDSEQGIGTAVTILFPIYNQKDSLLEPDSSEQDKLAGVGDN